uniref:CARD domain-containing protein n=1 Tax=Poecilia mexicana TaxID=48701 RepID=A0A3B3XR26_9TELE
MFLIPGEHFQFVSHHIKETRTRIIDGISEPVLQSLLDKLLEKKVLSDSEREAKIQIKTKTLNFGCSISPKKLKFNTFVNDVKRSLNLSVWFLTQMDFCVRKSI